MSSEESARIVVLYGSQTGNSQEVAERIVREAKARKLKVILVAMDAFDVRHLLDKRIVIFVASTTGQGEHPSNMKRFWRFLLRRSLPATSLAGLHFAVFGLGDSGYLHYNVVAKKLDKRLKALGGQQIVEVGLGDDQHPIGFEAALDPWLTGLWRSLHGKHLLPDDVNDALLTPTAASLEPRYRVLELGKRSSPEDRLHGSEVGRLEEAAAAARLFAQVEAAASGTSCSSENDSTGYGPWRPYMAKVLTNRRMTAPTHFQDSRHIELDLGNSGLSYESGHLLAVFPQQPAAAVEDFLQRLGLDADVWVKIEPEGQANASQSPAIEVRIGALVSGVMDVAGASPRRFFFEVLQHFASNRIEAERLAYFASPEGKDDLIRYNQREGRTALEVLRDFESAAPPLEWLLQVVPRLQPRLFSIASSPRMHPAQVHIAAAVVDYLTPSRRRKRGLCTSWLAQLQPGALVPVWVEPGTMQPPTDPHTPMVLIGPGTGIAPFRAFLQDRLVATASAATPPAASLLYFGCRNEHGDFYYKDFWQQCQEAGVLSHISTAFSRDQASKVYVQDRIRQTASQLWGALQQGAAIYVCGSAKRMPQDVAAALEQVVMNCGNMTKIEAAGFLKQLELKGRYSVEAWS